jgi:cytochrome c-type biogenesis protein CcmH
MRRLAVVSIGLALLTGSAASSVSAADRPSAAELESQFICLTCKTTLDQSDSPIARRMKLYIRTRLRAGASEKQIRDELVDQFGEGVLASPPTHGFDLLAWALPIGGIGVGAVGIGALAWAWSRRRDEATAGEADTEPLDPELERRLDEELARFEP